MAVIACTCGTWDARHEDICARNNPPSLCPWCSQWHSADDDLCPAIPDEPVGIPESEIAA